MGKGITFFIAEDDSSYSIAVLLDDLIRELGKDVKLSSQRYLGAVITEARIKLQSNFNKSEEMSIVVYSISDRFKDEYKTRFGILDLPAVNIGGRQYIGEEAVDIASDLCSLLSSKDNLSSERIFYYLSRYTRKPVERQARHDDRIRRDKGVGDTIMEFYRSIFGELAEKLNRLRAERKIGEKKYRKIMEIYAQLLGIE